MDTSEITIRYPDPGERLDQNEEWIVVEIDGEEEKIRLHDYARFFEIPGLYEELVYRQLKCCSPVTICSLLKQEMEKAGVTPEGMRVLDFGAGNGMIGECLDRITGYDRMVGLDIIEQARDAAERDYPGIYDGYYVADLSQLEASTEAELKRWRFNTLITVAALGYGDIPTRAFTNAFNMIEDNGWIAFNIKERFTTEADDSGYHSLLDQMFDRCMVVKTIHRYCHRLSLAGEPLYYHAVVGRKTQCIRSEQSQKRPVFTADARPAASIQFPAP